MGKGKGKGHTVTDLPLVQLLFRSTARPGLDTASLHELGHGAAQPNAAADLTGLLICHEDCVVQWLEGPGHAVQAAWSRIRLDQRHGAIERLPLPAGGTRLLADWRTHLSACGAQPVAGGIALPADTLAALLHPQADLVEGLPGLSFWRALPAPDAMARCQSSLSEACALVRRQLGAGTHSAGAWRP
jgi:Sensors of blue-light using FAD